MDPKISIIMRLQCTKTNNQQRVIFLNEDKNERWQDIPFQVNRIQQHQHRLSRNISSVAL